MDWLVGGVCLFDLIRVLTASQAMMNHCTICGYIEGSHSECCDYYDSYPPGEPTLGEKHSAEVVKRLKAGECEHEWCKTTGEVPGYKCTNRYCCVTRTVADFWKREPPEHPNPKALCWARNRWIEPGKNKDWRQAILVSVNFEKQLVDKEIHEWSEWQFFHHPDYIIEPPPTPDSSHVPDP